MAQGILAPVSEMDLVEQSLANQQLLDSFKVFPDIEGRRSIGGLGYLLPVDMAEDGGDFELAVPQFIKNAVNFASQKGAGALGKAPMMPLADQAMGMMDFTGSGLLVNAPTRMAASEAGEAMLGSAGGNPFFNVSDEDYQAILRGAENTRRTLMSPNTVANPDGTYTRSAPTGLLAEDFGYSPFTQDRTDPLNMTVTYRDKGEIIKPEIIMPSDIEGQYVLNMPSDRSVANREILGFNDTMFETPIDAQGGIEFPLYNSEAWRSEQGIVSGMANSVLGEPAKKGKDVYGATSVMGPLSNDFSHHVMDGILEGMKSAKITKAGIKQYDAEMKKSYKDWPGIKSANLREYLLRDKQGAKRKKMANVMAKSEFKKLGFPDLVPIRVGTSKDELAYTLKDITGQSNPTSMTMAKLDPEAKTFADDGHTTYKTAIQKAEDAPKGLGYPIAIPRILQFPDFFAMKRAEGKDPMQDRRSFEISSILQEQRPEVVDNQEMYIDLFNRGLLFK